MRTLYHHWLSPVSRKIRLIMGEKKLDHRLRVERPWSPTEELTDLNPAGNLPVLKDVNDVVVSQNHAVTEYLEEAYPGRDLLGSNLHQRAEVRRLSDWFDEIFYQDVTHKLVFEKVMKRNFGQGHTDTSVIRQGQANLQTQMKYIEALLEKRNWLAGDFFSIADISAAAQLSCLDYLGDLSWDKYPVAKDWYVRIKSRPSFRTLLNDNLPGITPAKHYANLDF